MPTSTMLMAKGSRQPHSRNWSPDIWLKASTARFAGKRPHGTPNWGQEAMKPREPCERAHSIERRTEPPHSPPTPTPWMKPRIVRITAPQMPNACVGRDQRHKKGRDAHQHKCGYERRLATNPISIMTADRGPDRTCDEPHRINGEGLQGANQGIGAGEEQLGEN